MSEESTAETNAEMLRHHDGQLAVSMCRQLVHQVGEGKFSVAMPAGQFEVSIRRTGPTAHVDPEEHAEILNAMAQPGPYTIFREARGYSGGKITVLVSGFNVPQERDYRWLESVFAAKAAVAALHEREQISEVVKKVRTRLTNFTRDELDALELAVLASIERFKSGSIRHGEHADGINEPTASSCADQGMGGGILPTSGGY